MEGLQRSTTSFRRQGSSGLVWENRFLSEDLNQKKKKIEGGEGEEEEKGVEMRTCESGGSIGMIERSRSNGGYSRYRTGKVSPAIDPPSPKLSACGFCGVFAKPVSTHRSKKGKRKP